MEKRFLGMVAVCVLPALAGFAMADSRLVSGGLGGALIALGLGKRRARLQATEAAAEPDATQDERDDGPGSDSA